VGGPPPPGLVFSWPLPPLPPSRHGPFYKRAPSAQCPAAPAQTEIIPLPPVGKCPLLFFFLFFQAIFLALMGPGRRALFFFGLWPRPPLKPVRQKAHRPVREKLSFGLKAERGLFRRKPETSRLFSPPPPPPFSIVTLIHRYIGVLRVFFF